MVTMVLEGATVRMLSWMILQLQGGEFTLVIICAHSGTGPTSSRGAEVQFSDDIGTKLSCTSWDASELEYRCSYSGRGINANSSKTETSGSYNEEKTILQSSLIENLAKKKNKN